MLAGSSAYSFKYQGDVLRFASHLLIQHHADTQEGILLNIISTHQLSIPRLQPLTRMSLTLYISIMPTFACSLLHSPQTPSPSTFRPAKPSLLQTAILRALDSLCARQQQ